MATGLSFSKRVGAAIREIRMEKRKRLKDFAGSSIHPNRLCSIEMGNYNVTLETIDKIAALLQVVPEEFFTRALRKIGYWWKGKVLRVYARATNTCLISFADGCDGRFDTRELLRPSDVKIERADQVQCFDSRVPGDYVTGLVEGIYEDQIEISTDMTNDEESRPIYPVRFPIGQVGVLKSFEGGGIPDVRENDEVYGNFSWALERYMPPAKRT